MMGTYRTSEGVFEPNLARNEIGDGYDTLDWIAKQPWSDGHIGMFGESTDSRHGRVP